MGGASGGGGGAAEDSGPVPRPSGGGGGGSGSGSSGRRRGKSSSDEEEDEGKDAVTALRQVCRLLRDANRDKGRFMITVRRAAVVDTVVAEFAFAPKEKLLRKLHVSFSGEAGIDAGGLTKDMYSCFFAALTDPSQCGLFECDPDAEHPTFLPAKEEESASAGGGAGCGEDPLLASYEAVGRVIAKAVLDEVPLAATFHPTLFRALLRGTKRLPVNLHELEAFSPTEARSCRQVGTVGGSPRAFPWLFLSAFHLLTNVEDCS
jgi:E3 ubiquitin-protein ligase HUWE1